MHTALGITITVVTLWVLAIAFLRHRRFSFPRRGWIGLTLLVAAKILMFRQVWPVNVYFTPLAWTAYLLIADSMVQAITGTSRMKDSPRAFLLCAALSIPLWTIFEAYNLRLENWTYVGVPVSWPGALLGYGWSFATITPAILETADLIEAFAWFNGVYQGTTTPRAAQTAVQDALKRRGLSRAERVPNIGHPDMRHSERASAREEPAVSNSSAPLAEQTAVQDALKGRGLSRAEQLPDLCHSERASAREEPAVSRMGYKRIRFSPRAERGMIIFGAACLITPLLLPQHVAAYLFALVWVGFVFLLDPINHRRGLPSLLGDLAEGRRERFYSLLLSGWVCGWLWEFWNNWAAAKWHYIFPMFQGWKIFEMPAPGYLGFLPFALECFVMYVTATAVLGQRSAARSRP